MPARLVPLFAVLVLVGCDYVAGGGTRGGEPPDPIRPVRLSFHVEDDSG